MTVSVVPIARLPASLTTFDYSVPPELMDTIRVGQLVNIPFREKKVFGIVVEIKRGSSDEVSKKVKTLFSIINTVPIFNAVHLDFLQRMSRLYKVSYGTLAKMMLPPLQKRKLQKIDLTDIGSATKKQDSAEPVMLGYETEEEHQGIVEKAISGTTLIVVPEIHLIERLHTLLSPSTQSNVVLWHSNLSTKEQFESWKKVRNSEKKIIIGTRGAVFLPFPALDTIIIDYEHHEQHKHRDQAPRFHVKDVGKLLCDLFGSSLYLASFCASCDVYFHTHKGHFKGNIPKMVPKKKLHVVDMREEARAGRYGILSEVAKNTLQASRGDIFLYIQQRGFSSSIQCGACGYIAICDTCNLPYIFHSSDNAMHCHYCKVSVAMSHTCNACGQSKFVLKGVGTEFLFSGAQSFFSKNDDLDIIKVDSDSTADTSAYHKRRRVIVGTEMAFSHVRWGKTDTIIFVNIDKQLNHPEYLATEHVWQKIQETLYAMNHNALLVIQTWNPKNIVCRSLHEPDRFYRTELNTRRQLQYPPYGYLVRYCYGGDSKKASELHANEVYARLKETLTKEKKSGILLFLVAMNPGYFRKKYWYAIVAKLDMASYESNLLWLNQSIPESWKVDPHPLSLLQP